MKEIIQENGTFVSIAFVLIIIVCIYLCYQYIKRVEKEDGLLAHRGTVEMLPSLVSTLGVLGTFLGITMGLLFFDTRNLETSIPMLLDGLKTAFFTSLAGMAGSLFLSKKVNDLYDKKSGGISDSTEAAGIIVKELEKQNASQVQFYNTMLELVKKIIENTSQDQFYASMQERAKAIMENSSTQINRLESINLSLTSLSTDATAIKQSQQSIDGKTDSILQSVGNIEESGKDMLTKADQQGNQIGELLDHTDALVSGQGEIEDHVAKFGDRLHSEIVEIEDKMTDTNRLLVDKFNEFSELLKKSNTEALVEVMKNVTEEFQKQMNSLINKLIQENFEQLNKSVESLNQWQQENKQMIQSLTMQYRQMAENFENTSTSLTKVDEDTRQLVSEGGKLHQIVNSLNKVIVEDEKFIQISTGLQKTTELSKSNFEQFDAATKQLNDWVKKQRNFVDGVVVLIQKLDELGKIKDYGEEFWKETRKGMNDGVSIIKDGSESLNKQVAGLNNQFYARLSTTLAQLDNCIQALVSNAEKR